MDRAELYQILDIEEPSEFKYFENLQALLETDGFVEQEHIKELLMVPDSDTLDEMLENFFDGLIKYLPDEESEMYMTLDNIERVMRGYIEAEMKEDQAAILADEIVKFRKWYVIDELSLDKKSGKLSSVRDAIYNLMAAKYTNENYDYDFENACKYEFDGYDVKLSDLINGEI